MYVASGVALALLVAIGLVILAGIMKQLGGDPSYAVSCARWRTATCASTSH
jgi:methyl-accepting chemotaxis protein